MHATRLFLSHQDPPVRLVPHYLYREAILSGLLLEHLATSCQRECAALSLRVIVHLINSGPKWDNSSVETRAWIIPPLCGNI